MLQHRGFGLVFIIWSDWFILLVPLGGEPAAGGAAAGFFIAPDKVRHKKFLILRQKGYICIPYKPEFL